MLKQQTETMNTSDIILFGVLKALTYVSVCVSMYTSMQFPPINTVERSIHTASLLMAPPPL